MFAVIWFPLLAPCLLVCLYTSYFFLSVPLNTNVQEFLVGLGINLYLALVDKTIYKHILKHRAWMRDIGQFGSGKVH